MLRFRSMRSLQKFASVHASVHNHFNQERALDSRQKFKANRAAAAALQRGKPPSRGSVPSNSHMRTIRELP